MAFNPKAYALTARETLEKLDERIAFEKSNGHLALPFFVEGLRSHIPPLYPGDTAIILARSHEGKSNVLKSWANQHQDMITRERRRALVAMVSHEDTAEMTAEQQVERTGSRDEYADDPFLYIGRSFGMRPEDIAEMHMSNIAATLYWAMYEKFAEKMPIASVFYDYLQKTPPDPERRKMIESSQRRLQIADDVTRLCNAAVTLMCPIVAGSQASLKHGFSSYTTAMPIPGAGDTEEAKEIYQLPDRVFSIWHVARTPGYYPGREIEDGKWKFKVEDNLAFLWVLKVRYHQPRRENKRYAAVGRVFPLHINERGDYIYDPEYHRSIVPASRPNTEVE